MDRVHLHRDGAGSGVAREDSCMHIISPKCLSAVPAGDC